VNEGATGSATVEETLARLAVPRVLWLMLPAALVDETIRAVSPHLKEGDIVIDGGNSYYRDDIRRAGELQERGVHYVDVGTSGGVWGLERGYCLMIGGQKESVSRLDPLFTALAPGIDAASRTSGREKGNDSAAEHGYLHCGPSGAGHFVKMVHNGIEYAVMAAYAEGFNILRHADSGRKARDADAETAPLRDPDYYLYDFNLADIAELWRRGSVISSWLLDLCAKALLDSHDLNGFQGLVADSGEGRWTIMAAIDEGVPAQVLSAALYERFSSQGKADFADRLLSAMRHGFGGHQEKSA
jgi:6-phosphogluconate dehydrogenase